jgi:carboxypeptidase C (cathepsin A)
MGWKGNWFGGEAISLALQYSHSEEFRASGYEAMVVDGTEYGEVRQYGNFSFARVYESGHEIPYYQRKSSFPLPIPCFGEGLGLVANEYD